MKISYNWLKEFITIDQYSPQQLAEILLSIGMEVSELTGTLKPGFEKIISAKVLNTSKHPNADNLTVCSLTDGEKEYSVICGAKNVASGDIVSLALPGSSLPKGERIKKVSLRGIKSEGMICSSMELGIDDEHAGIMHFDSETPLGQGIEKILELDDYIFDIEIHANRPDCMGHLGIAREIAAKLGLTVHHLMINSTEKSGNEFFPVEISNPELCLRYIVFVLSDLKIGSSNSKIKIRLKNCGLRPINNVVDITNYVLLEFGHPLHAFDLDKISGQKIFVRKANAGESIKTLEDKSYNLDKEALIIADTEKPLAIAGIIGGADSCVTADTKRVLLESALFNATNIRLTRQLYQIATESSNRFERSLSWEICQIAGQRAVYLLTQLCSANYISKTDIRTADLKRKKIIVRPWRVDRILATQTEKKEIAEILTRLGMTVTPQAEHLSIEVPSWRQDIEEEIDIIEDIARQMGYDKIPADTECNISLHVETDKKVKIEEAIKGILHSAGFYEAMNYSMVSEKSRNILKNKNYVEIENPISQEFKYLRTTLAAGLFSNVERNINNRNECIKLYEFGKVYFKDSNFIEEDRIGMICTGTISRDNWKYNNEKIDFYFLSGVINSILEKIGIKNAKMKETSLLSDIFHPGKSSAKTILNNGEEELLLCEFGMIKPGLFSDISNEVFYAEFYLNNLLKNAGITTVFEPYINLPKLKRDISLVVPKELQYESVLNEILSPGQAVKINVILFDVYQGGKIPEDKKGIGLRLTFCHETKTLEDSEINAIIDEMLERLKRLNVHIRNA